MRIRLICEGKTKDAPLRALQAEYLKRLTRFTDLAVEEIRPGDVVVFAPGEKHWHGAAATTGMTHIAIQEKLNGKAVDWMEHVTDEQYRK